MRSPAGAAWRERVCVHSLVHTQEAQQRLIGLFVQTQDPLPVLNVGLLLLQPVQREERRVEPREEQRQEQRGAAHHHSAATKREEGGVRGYITGKDDVTRARPPEVFHTEAALDSGRRPGGVRDDVTIIWQPWKQKPAAAFPVTQ